MTPAQIAKRNQLRVVVAFASVYLLWGSTYLFIKYAIETIPPFLLGFTRFAIAGGALYALARWRGGAKPTLYAWKMAAITGVLMLGFGNGAVMWAEKTVPSGVVALIVSSVPIWIAVLNWMRPNGRRPQLSVFAGLALGLVGMVILIGPRAIIGQGHIDEAGTAILVGGSIAWAIGSLVTRSAKNTGSPIVFAALQMLAASGAMLIMSLALGEPAGFTMSAVSGRSVVSFVYLILAGSIIGYTAYVYLLGAVGATKAATYAYVNPVIAVLLGWAFANEPLGMRTVIAAAVILAGVAIITGSQSPPAATGEHPIPRPTQPERTAA